MSEANGPFNAGIVQDYHVWHAKRVTTCLDHLAKHVERRRLSTCLDLGHDPEMGNHLRQLGLDLTGNIHPDSPRPKVDWKLVPFDFETSFPFADESFDLVTAFEVIEHVVATPRGFLREIYRVLRPGGMLYLGTPNVTSWAKVRRVLAHCHPYDALPYSMNFGPRHAMCHVYEYDSWTLKQLLISEDFDIVDCRTWDVYDADPHGLRAMALRALVTASLGLTGYLKDAAQIWRLRGHQIGLVAEKRVGSSVA